MAIDRRVFFKFLFKIGIISLIPYKAIASLNKIECELDYHSFSENKTNLIQSTLNISNMVKVLFIKNYDVHSLFIVNTDSDLKKGYYITQNYRIYTLLS